MQPRYLQELIKNLQEFYKCPSCETNYHFDDIRFLGEIDLYCFVQLSCHSCSLPVLATVSVNGKGNAKHKTDLKQNEEAKFATKGAISAGEIAEFHRWVSKARSFSKRK
ncbi:hypothetical protein HJC99_02095 [Candidatus Saccharibacteria bacterium]|nr:hypothetical protein [Candidatus Saccharibacteria bacterium]